MLSKFQITDTKNQKSVTINDLNNNKLLIMKVNHWLTIYNFIILDLIIFLKIGANYLLYMEYILYIIKCLMLVCLSNFIVISAVLTKFLKTAGIIIFVVNNLFTFFSLKNINLF